MLNPHRLDDQNFIDIVNRSRRLIQKYAADWTNENASDPGITILEMLSWLKDNMQYYMDQSHLISRRAYMELLGITPKTGTPASMVATINYKLSANSEFDTLPKGYPVWADGTRFELSESLQIQKGQIKSVYSSDIDFEGTIFDLMGAFENNATAYPFGEIPEENKALYIGFDTLELGKLQLYMDIQKDPDGFRTPCDFSKIAFSKVIWEIAQPVEGNITWHEIEVVEDDTHGFMQSGIVNLNLNDGEIHTYNLLKGEEAFVWLRCKLIQSAYDRAPILKNITLNTAKLNQVHTILQCHHLIEHMDNEGHLDQIIIEEYVPEGADILIEMKTETGYKTIDKSNYEIVRHANGTVSITLNEHHASIDVSNIRLLSGDPKFGGIKTYTLQGLPYEEKETALAKTLFDTIKIEISEDFYSDKWIPWNIVHHLWNSKSGDRHVQFDVNTGTFQFGNNEMGMLPDSKEDALRIIEASISLKKDGNGTFKTLLIDEIMSEFFNISPISKASGGSFIESEEEAFIRFKRELDAVTRMMSKSHIEEIIMKTPGLAIRDVAVIANEQIGENGRIIALSKTQLKNTKLPDIYVEAINKQIQNTVIIFFNKCRSLLTMSGLAGFCRCAIKVIP